jgi:hypothetical protein
MNDENGSTDKSETVRLVKFAETAPTSLSGMQGEVGRGVHGSPAEPQPKSAGLKNLNLLTDDEKKNLALLSDLGLLIKKRIWDGKGTISDLMEAAKQANGMKMSVRNFALTVFKGKVNVRDQRVGDGNSQTIRTHDGHITRAYCLGFAKDWDTEGEVDPVDFVDALAMETMGHKRYVDTAEALEQIFRQTKGINTTPSGEDNGSQDTHTYRWK